MKYKYRKPFIRSLRTISLVGQRPVVKIFSRYHYESVLNTLPCDIVIAGYPKSGNTWVQNLFASAIFGVDGEFMPDKLTQELVPDLDYKVFYKRFLSSMVFKTHEQPKSNFRRVIHLVRDPRDVMASYVAMRKGLGKIQSNDEIIIDQEGLLFGSWSEHTQAWLRNPYDSEVHTLKYEDLLVNPLETMVSALQFCKIERPSVLVQKAIDSNSLCSLRRKENYFGYDKDAISSDKWAPGTKFVREGKQGRAKSVLSDKHLEFLEKTCKNQIRQLGYPVKRN